MPLTSSKLDECLESYFAQSEQLDDAARSCSSDEQRVAGLLLQVLPGHGEERAADAFETAAACAATVSIGELTELAGRGAVAEAVRGARDPPVRGAPVAHDCRCTPERLAGVVRMLGADEVKSLLAEQGHVELKCEFCNRAFRYDEHAAQTILRGGTQSSVLH